MKERPILFSTPMVEAILAGTKTQTRRIAKLSDPIGNTPCVMPCKYGETGDRLWVREKFRKVGIVNTRYLYVFMAGQPKVCVEEYERNRVPWKPSIHMPREACRIMLEITNVRTERLQSINNVDALAEGTPDYRTMDNNWDLRDCYRHLWNKINGKDSWDQNPFVWVIEFKRVK